MTALSVVFGAYPASQLVATLQTVEVVPVQVSVDTENTQLVLLSELWLVAAVMLFTAVESFTST